MAEVTSSAKAEALNPSTVEGATVNKSPEQNNNLIDSTKQKARKIARYLRERFGKNSNPEESLRAVANLQSHDETRAQQDHILDTTKDPSERNKELKSTLTPAINVDAPIPDDTTMQQFENETRNSTAPSEQPDDQSWLEKTSVISGLDTDEEYNSLRAEMLRTDGDPNLMPIEKQRRLVELQNQRNAAAREGYKRAGTIDDTPPNTTKESFAAGKPQEAVHTLPTDVRNLKQYYIDNLKPILDSPMETFKKNYTPELAAIYRNYLTHMSQALIDNRPSKDVSYPDTDASIVGNNPAFLQRAIFCETGQVVDISELLRTPFSQIAKEFNIHLPDNYATVFKPRLSKG